MKIGLAVQYSKPSLTRTYTIIVIKFLCSLADPYPDQTFIRIQAKTISTYPYSDKKGFSNKKIIFFHKTLIYLVSCTLYVY